MSDAKGDCAILGYVPTGNYVARLKRPISVRTESLTAAAEAREYFGDRTHLTTLNLSLGQSQRFQKREDFLRFLMFLGLTGRFQGHWLHG
jgi:hypothetical protein